jgi:hypothetical protein
VKPTLTRPFVENAHAVADASRNLARLHGVMYDDRMARPARLVSSLAWSEERSAAAAMLFEEDHHVDPSQGGSAQSLWRATSGGPSESPSQPMRKHYRHVSPAV